jgi:hypothetical protein
MISFVFEDIDNLLNCFDENEAIQHTGSYRITQSPYANGLKMTLVYNQSTDRDSTISEIPYLSKRYKINFYSINEEFDGKYIIPIGVNQSPREWMPDFYVNSPLKFKNIFDKLPEKYLSDLQSGRAYLMIDNSLEGYHDDGIFDHLHNSAVSRFISPDNIIYVTGNLIVDEQLKNWTKINKGKVPIRVIPYPHFQNDIGIKTFDLRKHDGSPLPSTWTHHQRKESLGDGGVKIFNFLNKKPRPHRMWMYTALSKWNLLDKGIISMNPTEYNEEINIDYNILPSEDIIEMNSTLPVYAYGDNTNDKEFDYYMYNFNQNACLDSYISIISETHFEDAQGTLFLSEKTFKTIACQSPFMVLGNKGSLKKLHKMGYKTFHDIIDERYDELDSIHRINAIIDEIRRWESNPDKFQHLQWLYPILEHNVEVMKFNAYFNPPAGFHMLNTLSKNEL